MTAARPALPLLLALLLAPALRAQTGEPGPEAPPPASGLAAPDPALPAEAPEPPPPAPPPPFAARGGPAPAELDRAIDETLARRDFSWRMRTRSETVDEAAGPLDRLLESIGRWIKRTWEKFIRALRRFLAWWDRLFRRDMPGELPPLRTTGLGAPSKALLWGLAAALVAAVALLLLRHRRRAAETPATGLPAPPLPDLEREETTADQLPESGWLALASDLAQRGDWRLALRALHLAALAELGARGFVTITRAKTHSEYRRELARKASDRPGMRAAFDALVPQFEEVWYGEHPADEARYLRFAKDAEALRGASA